MELRALGNLVGICWDMSLVGKFCENLPRPSGRGCAQQPPANEFACVLGTLLVGRHARSSKLLSKLHPPWTRAILMQAMKRCKVERSSHECGLTSGFVNGAPEELHCLMFSRCGAHRANACILEVDAVDNVAKKIACLTDE